MKDLIRRQAAIDAVAGGLKGTFVEYRDVAEKMLNKVPPAQPTLYGYNIEHLVLIATLLQKENLPPERVGEAIADIGRVVSIVRAEFEEELQKSIERWMIEWKKRGDK